jgi:hypothetical protein
MVEVFKTNVQHADHAKMLIEEIHATFRNYTANFDLEDCDRILRVESSRNFVEVLPLLELLKRYGFDGEVLADDKPVNEILQS